MFSLASIRTASCCSSPPADSSRAGELIFVALSGALQFFSLEVVACLLIAEFDSSFNSRPMGYLHFAQRNINRDVLRSLSKVGIECRDLRSIA